MEKLNFQQPLLQSSVSHDPSEIILICWFGAQETFLLIIIIIIINVENSCCLIFFVETMIFFSKILCWNVFKQKTNPKFLNISVSPFYWKMQKWY